MYKQDYEEEMLIRTTYFSGKLIILETIFWFEEIYENDKNKTWHDSYRCIIQTNCVSSKKIFRQKQYQTECEY